MKVSARGRDLGLAVVLLGLPTLMLSFGPERPGAANWLDQTVLRLVTLPGAAIAASAEQVSGAWRSYMSLVGVREQADGLRSENARLKRKVQLGLRKGRELDSCRALLRFSAERDLDAVGARVIGRSSSPFVRALRLRLDQGSATLRTGLAVVTAAGIVGRVGRVYGDYADVQLAVDPQHSVDVLVERTATRGLVTGVEASERYVLRLAYVTRDLPVEPGDRVVTSGAGGVFPAGVLVGTVSRVRRGDVGLYQDLVVRPAVDFSTLREVLVLVSLSPQAEVYTIDSQTSWPAGRQRDE